MQAGPSELLEMANSLLETESLPQPEQLEALASLLRSPDPGVAALGARVIGRAAASDEPPLAEEARRILRTAAISGAVPVALENTCNIIPLVRG
jgi:hypothetical protein